MIIVFSIIIAFVCVLYQTFVKKILNEKNRQNKQELEHQKEISQQYIIVQEKERKRIAETLHDEVGSKLNLLSLWMNNDDTWDTKRSKVIVAQLIPELIDATRNISHVLYPAKIEEFGLVLTLEELITKIDTSLIVELIVNHGYNKKSISFEVQIYRIIQEFLSNVIKHSTASKMSIQIRDSVKFFSIILSDNGIGFDVNNPQNGMGLKNIVTRIQSINAVYKWKNKKGIGCTLIIFANNGRLD